MSVSILNQMEPGLLEAVNHLVPQLSSSTPPLSEEVLRSFLAQESIYLFVYRSPESKILGMLTLATFDLPTGKRAWIEDVVVDGEARGNGAGEQLVKAAVAYAKEIGSKSIDLTSRPSREAANRLYRRCGFELRETNVYRYKG
ncbi:GNAT family N-acetyltransferase [Arcanobacterium haemolyticum]|nr:GNAT family N-acetyltransferase [Arcanobacterium haemolyticum]